MVGVGAAGDAVGGLSPRTRQSQFKLAQPGGQRPGLATVVIRRRRMAVGQPGKPGPEIGHRAGRRPRGLREAGQSPYGGGVGREPACRDSCRCRCRCRCRCWCWCCDLGSLGWLTVDASNWRGSQWQEKRRGGRKRLEKGSRLCRRRRRVPVRPSFPVRPGFPVRPSRSHAAKVVTQSGEVNARQVYGALPRVI